MVLGFRILSMALASMALLSTSALVGCSSSDGDSSPATHELLYRAAPLQFGCTYTQSTHSSYGTSSRTEKIPKCTEGVRCDDLYTPDSTTDYAGGNAFYESVQFDDRVNFVGTCAVHTPVPGVKNAFEGCYAAPYLCEIDPNCQAIIDCLKACADDTTCGQACTANGEAGASHNLSKVLECVDRGLYGPT